MDKPHCPVPCEPAVAAFVAGLDDDAREFFEERAAIAEYDANLTRPEAEARAYRLTVAYRKSQQAPPK